MAGQRKKSKKRITLPIESALLLAVEIQAAREKTDRIKWINETLTNRLRELGKLP